jgi:hypothetical protein
MLSSSFFAHCRSSTNRLRKGAVDLMAEIFVIERQVADDQGHHAAKTAEDATRQMGVVADWTVNALEKLAAEKDKRDRAKRDFQAKHNISRDVKRPNALATILIIVIGFLFECVFTTTSLFSDGHMDLVLAMGFAATFSCVNVALGLAAGACLRFVAYRNGSILQEPGYATIRWIARCGFAMIVLVNLAMIFVGGRVRVTGGHDDIFNFADVSFAATFADGLALVIMVAAALSCGVAMWKAYGGFTDPIPGYGVFADAFDGMFGDEAEFMVATTQDHLASVSEAAGERIEDSWMEVEEQAGVFADLLTYNGEVQDAKREAQVFAIAELERERFVQGDATAPSAINLDAFDGLEIDPDTLSFAASKQHILDSLRANQDQASAKVMAAYAAYTAQRHSAAVLPTQS